MSNIFELASIHRLRFPSAKGDLTTEDLWILPLTSGNGFNLDNVARAVNSQLTAQAEESFVNSTVNPAKTRLELALEVVKHIIAIKLADQEAARTKAANLAQRDKLISILADKQDAALKDLTPDELVKRIAGLS